MTKKTKNTNTKTFLAFTLVLEGRFRRHHIYSISWSRFIVIVFVFVFVCVFVFVFVFALVLVLVSCLCLCLLSWSHVYVFVSCLGRDFVFVYFYFFELSCVHQRLNSPPTFGSALLHRLHHLLLWNTKVRTMTRRQ